MAINVNIVAVSWIFFPHTTLAENLEICDIAINKDDIALRDLILHITLCVLWIHIITLLARSFNA